MLPPPPTEKRFLVASCDWKGSWRGGQVNTWIAECLRTLPNPVDIRERPLSDGGDGWLTMVDYRQNIQNPLIQSKSIGVMGPLPEITVEAPYLWDPTSQTAWFESSGAHGLRHLGDQTADVMRASSFGVGQAIAHILKTHPEIQQLIVSVGGSASVDAGLGCLQALGWRCLDDDGGLIEAALGGGDIHRVATIESPLALPKVSLNVVLDVTTPFTDAPRIFGPQKGADPTQVEHLTQAFKKLLENFPDGQALALKPGSGAAGGLPWALSLAFGPETRWINGTNFMVHTLKLEADLDWADAVITGEGRFDDTSLAGKATGYLIDACQKRHKPLVILTGQNDSQKTVEPTTQIIPLFSNDETPDLMSLKDSEQRLKSRMKDWISATVSATED